MAVLARSNPPKLKLQNVVAVTLLPHLVGQCSAVKACCLKAINKQTDVQRRHQPRNSLIILETMSLVTNQQVAGSFTLESICMRSEGLVGYNEHLQEANLIKRTAVCRKAQQCRKLDLLRCEMYVSTPADELPSQQILLPYFCWQDMRLTFA